ncbi:baseplate wedge subunit [Serratia phage PS2]|uniref:Baseplate wedge protein gp6 n=1 Tax=Serratia phage PS2 TaxID=1481112 RepID=A0A023W565_9CAUD|nr:baseplate wedge subunit [Serratia phage PS2]AHY25410.1 baseplate wedge subunit [Serratia phage PS2]
MNQSLKRQVNNIPVIFAGATFDEIKKDFVDWLSTQDEFKDFDFSGARINVLNDLLAYSVLYLQQFSNSALNESFLQTARLRSSVVQAAQDKGYMPASRSASATDIMLVCTHLNSPVRIQIPRGTKILGKPKDKGEPYAFVVTEDVTRSIDKNKKYFVPVKIAQGRIIRTQLSFDPAVKILIRDEKIDRESVRVTVGGAIWANWTNESMVRAGSTSSVYYMRETIDGHTEVFFGEGQIDSAVIDYDPEYDDDGNEITPEARTGQLTNNYIGGLKPTKGTNIVIEYIRTEGEVANGCTEFSYVDTLKDITVEQVIENPSNDADYVGSNGGGDPEPIERIRELATIKRESQDRAVTASDYEAFVSAKFGNIVQAVQCFTQKDKPGYAFVAIKPKNGLNLSTVQREDIKGYLNAYNLATITPSIINPDYMFLQHDVKVTYDLNKLSESEQWLEGKIIDSIDKYYTDEVEIFNKSFAKSRMLTYIDNSDISIIGSQATLRMVREVPNFYETPMSGIKYNNQIASQSLESGLLEFESAPGKGSYEIRYVSTKPNPADAENRPGQAWIVAGPFKDGDVTVPSPPNENGWGREYTGSDFNKLPVTDRSKYYVIGEYDTFTSTARWNLKVLQLQDTQFQTDTIELYADPVEDNIFTKDGSLIVFENDLRPQYTKITLEPIAQ